VNVHLALALGDDDVVDLQRTQLADAKPRVAEQQDDCEIAPISFALGCTENPIDVALQERLWYPPGNGNALDVVCRKLGDKPLALRPAEESPESSEATIDGRGGSPLHHTQIAAVVPQICWGHGPSREGLADSGGEPPREGGKVSLIGSDGFGCKILADEVGQEIGDVIGSGLGHTVRSKHSAESFLCCATRALLGRRDR